MPEHADQPFALAGEPREPAVCAACASVWRTSSARSWWKSASGRHGPSEFENAPAPSGNSIGIAPSVEAHDTTIITPPTLTGPNLTASPWRTRWSHNPGERQSESLFYELSQRRVEVHREDIRALKEAWASVAPDAMDWVASGRAWKTSLVFRRAQQSTTIAPTVQKASTARRPLR